MIRPPSAFAPPSQGDPTAISGLSGTLYLGKLPSKPAEGYLGVLPARPPATPKGTALVGLQLGTQQPLFSLLVAGDSVYAASGSQALLQVRTQTRAGPGLPGASAAGGLRPTLECLLSVSSDAQSCRCHAQAAAGIGSTAHASLTPQLRTHGRQAADQHPLPRPPPAPGAAALPAPEPA